MAGLRRYEPVFILLIYALIGAIGAWLMRDLRFDDPFITYRYAENLAAGRGFRFNPGEPTLITTAPLYALILAGFRLVGADIPRASYLIGAISIVGAAAVLYWLARQQGGLSGAVTGLVFILFPLTWLTLGFETPLFLFITLLVFLAVDDGRLVLAGIGAGIALGLRGDGFVVLAAVMLFTLYRGGITAKRPAGRPFLSWLVKQARQPLLILIVALLVYAPLAIWLTAQFGSPLPSTLQTKSAQAVSGLTGFYPHTTFLEGGWLLLRSLVLISPSMVILFGAAVIGAASFSRNNNATMILPVAWAAAHLAGYVVLGVSPYVWYYAPLVPGLAVLVGSGTAWLWRTLLSRPGLRTVLTATLVAIMVGAEAAAILPIVQVLNGATPLPPSDVRAKLLPETKVDIYERVGKWMSTHTPQDATFGVTELGVMSYYAGRHTVDFLGLTQPGYLSAVRHGDYLRALVREQPDYVALTAVNALYDFDPQRGAWFTAMYTPVVSLDDARFWGSPMTIWRRINPVMHSNIEIDAGAHDLGGGWQITAMRVNTQTVRAGAPLIIQVRLRAGKAAGARTLRLQPILIQGGDGLPVSSRLIYTNQWRPGEEDWVDFPILPADHSPRGGYIIEAGWQEGGPAMRAGLLKVPLGAALPVGAMVAPLSSGAGIVVQLQPVVACIGMETPLTLTWIGGLMNGMSYTAFVQVRAGDRTVAQADAPPRDGTYPTAIWSPGEVIPDTHHLAVSSDIAPGEYALVAGLYNPLDQSRLSVDPSPYRTADGGVKIGTVVIRQCQ